MIEEFECGIEAASIVWNYADLKSFLVVNVNDKFELENINNFGVGAQTENTLMKNE